MNKVKIVLFMAGISLALVFTFGCSSDDSGPTEQSYKYCITVANGCLEGPFTTSTCTGQLSNSCPNGSSSSIKSSGSSVIVSSSSVVQSSSSSGTSGTFIDSRDSKSYKWVKIGTQTWMAENLNYNISGAKCYGEGGKVMVSYDEETDTGTYATLSNAEIQANCAKYGRLYTWAMAMGIDAKYNEEEWGGSDVKHQGICPSGWHIPSAADWAGLGDFVEDESTIGTKFKARGEWDSYSGVPSGTDDFGFSALPGGLGIPDLNVIFAGVGNYGIWWRATEYGSKYGSEGAMIVSLSHDREYVGGGSHYKKALISVRCIKD